MDYYRGGKSLKPFRQEVKLDPATGLVLPTHGVSVRDRPDKLDRFGGPFRVTSVPPELKIIQRGTDRHHFEIVPAYPMPFAEYEDALDRIVLIPPKNGIAEEDKT
jgi:hypothetical protein